MKFWKAGVVAAMTAALPLGAAFAAACDNPRQMTGFKTCANVEQAEKEGALTVYSPDPETNQMSLSNAFMATFPKIKVTYLRLQTGALYAKLMAERQAKSYLVDVLTLSDMTFALDFQKRGGWSRYESTELAPFKPEHKSAPPGYFMWTGIVIAGIAYNPTTVKPADAPKSWKDALDPKWKDAINVKVSNSGLQHATWVMLKQTIGEDYWKQFASQNARAFDSYVQQFDRTVSGQDMVIHTAQYSGYLQFKAKGAPIAFVNPTEGVIAMPIVTGAVDQAQHPEAAKLYMDWLIGIPGQEAYVKATSLFSTRADVNPPPGGEPITTFKQLIPTDWDAFLKTHAQFVKEWNAMVGMR
ncbi:MAG: extracellular solute-binding protein [Acetobacteraceae bacterium]|nr:extracellular solute-binding protein [Acetobacteraceae bacterium]